MSFEKDLEIEKLKSYIQAMVRETSKLEKALFIDSMEKIEKLNAAIQALKYDVELKKHETEKLKEEISNLNEEIRQLHSALRGR
jgi:chromosome segregation ATPase